MQSLLSQLLSCRGSDIFSGKLGSCYRDDSCHT